MSKEKNKSAHKQGVSDFNQYEYFSLFLLSFSILIYNFTYK